MVVDRSAAANIDKAIAAGTKLARKSQALCTDTQGALGLYGIEHKNEFEVSFWNFSGKRLLDY